MAITSQKAKQYRALCNAVGGLLIGFSGVESIMQGFLKLHLAQQINLDDNDHAALQLASAIYGSCRFSASRDTMKRIMAAEGSPKPVLAFTADLFQQLGSIQSLRDMLAHQAFAADDALGVDEWVLSDMFTTRDTTNVKRFGIHTDAIELANSDLGEAMDRICAFESHPKLFSGGDTEPIPWRYKPSMLRLLS